MSMRTAPTTFEPFGNIEDDVDRATQLGVLQQVPRVADAHHLMAATSDRVLDDADGLIRVELGIQIRRIPIPQLEVLE